VKFMISRQWIISYKIDGDRITEVKTVKGFVGP
jgi:hypothetical protein